MATGNGSSTSTWNGGTLPATSDIVVANTFNVTIDSNQQYGTVQTLAVGSGATVTFTVSGGAIATVTATPPAGGTLYPVSATFPLLVTGGSGFGGYVTATTNSSGVITSYATTPATGAVVGTGLTANITAASGPITAATLVNGGSGYQVSATLTILVTGGGGTGGYLTCTTNASGVVTAITGIAAAGTGYSTTSGAATGAIQTGGSGYSGTTGAATSASGGSFILPDSSTLTANVLAGTTTALTYNGTASATIVGNVTGSTATTSAVGANVTNTGTLNITGNATAGATASASGVVNASNGTVTVTGNVTCSAGNSTYGILNNAAGTINVTGNLTGGSSSGIYALNNASSGTVTVTGNVTGGSAGTCYGVNNASTGTVTVIGNVTGGSNASAYGISSSAAAGVVSVTGTVSAGTAFGCVGVNIGGGTKFYLSGSVVGAYLSTQDGTTGFQSNNCFMYGGASNYTQYAQSNSALSGAVVNTSTITAASWTGGTVTITAANGFIAGQSVVVAGMTPSGYNGTFTVVSATSTQFTYTTSNPGTATVFGTAVVTGAPVTQYGVSNTSGASGQPSTANVVQGVVFGPTGSTQTGTCYVPAASSVAYGVNVGATTGTAVLTLANVQAALATRTGTCQSGSASGTIVLDAGASATNNLYLDQVVRITGGTGVGQTRLDPVLRWLDPDRDDIPELDHDAGQHQHLPVDPGRSGRRRRGQQQHHRRHEPGQHLCGLRDGDRAGRRREHDHPAIRSKQREQLFQLASDFHSFGDRSRANQQHQLVRRLNQGGDGGNRVGDSARQHFRVPGNRPHRLRKADGIFLHLQTSFERRRQFAAEADDRQPRRVSAPAPWRHGDYYQAARASDFSAAA